MTENEKTVEAAKTAGGAGQRLARLIDVKSLVTLALCGVLCAMTLAGRETTEIFNSAVMLVLGFFFGKNLNDKNDRNAG